MAGVIRSRSISQQATSEDVRLQIGRKQISGHTSILRFARNPDVSTVEETVWNLGGLYNYIDTAVQLQVSSSSADDTGAGTGARTIQVVGLNQNFEPKSEVLTLNGQTPVLTTNTFRRLFRGTIVNVGSGLANAGDVYVHNSAVVAGVPSTSTAIYGKISIGEGQTQSCTHTTPAGYTAYLMNNFYNGGRAANGGTFRLYTRTINEDDSYQSFRVREAVELVAASTSYGYAMPIQLPERTDLEVRFVNSTGNSPVSAAFELLIVNEVDKVSATIPALVL